MEEHVGPRSQYDFENGISDAAYLELNYTNSLGSLPWALNITETEVYPPSTPSDHEPTHQVIPGEVGVAIALDTKSYPPIFEATTRRLVDQDYMQRLAHFQVTIARMIDCEVDLGSAKL